MNLLDFYKGFPVEDDIYGFTLEAAASKAKHSIYESWFDVLKASPWYSEIQTTRSFKNAAMAHTYRRFGNLNNLTFEQWWKARGYKIFKEKIPFTEIKPVELGYKLKQSKDPYEPPTLLLEVPLHLDIKILRRQFDEVLRLQEAYQDKKKFSIYDNTTAHAKIFQMGQKFGYEIIKKDLNMYFEYQTESVKEGFIAYQFAQKHRVLGGDGVVTNALLDSEKSKLIGALKYALENTKKLIANATVGRFPDTGYCAAAQVLLD